MARTNIDRLPSEDHLVFNDQLPVGAELDVWIVFSSPHKAGTCIEGIFTSRFGAETHMKWCLVNDRNNSQFWIRRGVTNPHTKDNPK